MMDEVQLPVAKLEAVVELLLRRVVAVGQDRIVIDRDMFWSIPLGDAFEVYGPPPEATIGQVSESWDQLERVLAEPEDAVKYHLVWLADVLRAIAAQPGMS